MTGQPDTGPLRNVILWSVLVSVVSVNFSVALSSIAMGTAIGLWLLVLLRSRGTEFRRTPFDLLFVLYLIAELSVAVFSQEPANSLVNAKRLILISFVYLSLYALRTPEDLRLAVVLIVGVCSVTSLIEIFSLSFARGHLQRLSVFQYFLTEGGIKMIVFLLGLPLALSKSVPRRLRIWISAALVPIFTGLVLTQTRSSWLGLVAGLIVIGLRRYRWIIPAAALLIILFLLAAPRDLTARAVSIFDPAMPSNLTRIHMVTTGWRMFLDRPFTGFGDVDLRKYYITYIIPLDTAEGGHLHNNIMMLLVTLGIVGFTIVMTIFVRIAVRMWRTAASREGSALLSAIALGCLAAFAGFQVNGLFEWNFGDHEIAVLFWFLTGLVLVTERLRAGEAA
ncbi:MAG TPA: O-antigen ligase family protein [Bacteroidota bacterium]|nr:O-antigen ligase family protein [Bacteroidota bacterium]